MAKTGYTPTDPAVEQQLAEWHASSDAAEVPVRFRNLGFAIKAIIIGFLILWLVGLIITGMIGFIFLPFFWLPFVGTIIAILFAIRWVMNK